MLKGQSIIGKKVLSRLDGQRIDSVRDIVISKDHSRIVALILDEGGLFSGGTAVAIENVVSFGKDAVVITDSKTVTRVEHFPAVKEIMDDRDSLVGKRVFTESGDQMGKVEDVYFDENTGNITALEVEGKIVPTARNATVQLMMGDIVSIGPDAVIINLAAIPKLEAQVTSGSKQAEQPSPPQSQSATQDRPDVGSGGMQIGSAIPDHTMGSSMPMTSDVPPSMPSTAPLPSGYEGTGATQMGAGDSSEETPRSMGRVTDPTSGSQS